MPTVRVGASKYEVTVGDIAPKTYWRQALYKRPAIVVHLAALSHVMKNEEANRLESYGVVNVEDSMKLARQSAEACLCRFVFLSSIKVNGAFAKAGMPLTADDALASEDPYGASKNEAEQVLRHIAIETGMEIVIIRQPLVYGPGVKANFASMMRGLPNGVPLPLAAVTHNRRSMVALYTLLDLVLVCLIHPAAANQTFLVSDGEDLSTAELLRRMVTHLGFPD